MAVNFGGGETSSFATFNSIETTLSGSFKAPARCGIHTKKGGRIKASFSATSSQWFHLDMHVGLINSTLSPIVISDLSNSPLFTLMSSGSVKLGSTVVGSAPIVVAGLCTIDIHLVHGSSGLVEIFVNSQPVFSSTGDYNFSNMAYLTLSPIGTNSTDVTDTVWSQVIISDEITISNELATLVFTALGDLTDWGGQVSDINEVALDTSTYLNAPVAGQISTFVTSDLASQYINIKAVIVSALARYANTGPHHLSSVVRVSSVNYFSNMPSIGIGLTPTQTIYHTNPVNNSDWTRSAVNGAQFGLRSRI